jgi:hypothetical protein
MEIEARLLGRDWNRTFMTRFWDVDDVPTTFFYHDTIYAALGTREAYRERHVLEENGMPCDRWICEYKTKHGVRDYALGRFRVRVGRATERPIPKPAMIPDGYVKAHERYKRIFVRTRHPYRIELSYLYQGPEEPVHAIWQTSTVEFEVEWIGDYPPEDIDGRLRDELVSWLRPIHSLSD